MKVVIVVIILGITTDYNKSPGQSQRVQHRNQNDNCAKTLAPTLGSPPISALHTKTKLCQKI